MHGPGDLGGRGVLEQEAVRPGGERLVHVLVQVEGGERDDPGRVGELAQTAGGGDPVEPGHPDVHQRDVDPVPAGEFDGLQSVDGIGDHGQLRVLVQEVDQPEAHQRVVVDHHRADHAASSGCGG
ncbi:hypothetical protein GCM10010502_26920 [Kitasatospora aureofaciens]|uniref:Uncharacterized protein n=1 Tax=Kitasatospora aureofaciens TaxID=1894 RepID=A0A8H9HMV9_KITAU|nr:hypothetical protein GCM10010502_26920 [Kitasatospora aureofaciens]